MSSDTSANEVHIASFVVQHRGEAAAALATWIAASDDMELARSEGTRSIVLCECADQYGLLDRIEATDYDVFSGVVRIPRPQRARIAATTWARIAIGLPAR